MNLLLIITKLELGGAQKQLLTLLKGLDRTNFNLFLVTAQNGLLVEETASIEGLVFYRSRYLERPIHLLKDIFALFEISSFIHKHKIDIVHTHSSKAGIVGRWAAFLSGVKVIFHTVHGWSFNDFQHPLVRKLFIWLERIAAGFTNKILVVSEHDRNKGIEARIGKPDQYCLMRYGIDKAPFFSKDLVIRSELGITENELVVGTVSCFKPQKALHDFVALASLIHRARSGVKFLVVGDGVLRPKIEAEMCKLGLEKCMILAGWRRDISRLVSAMDVFVLTSLWEGLPISAIEAMAAAVPPVLTDTGGVREIIDEGRTGFLAPCQGMTSMLQKVLALLDDKSLRQKLGASAREKVRNHFEVRDMIRGIESLYREAFNTRQGVS